jgi:DNA polymerase elongation subunit (family B)
MARIEGVWAIDIETYANVDAEKFLPDVKADSRLKDEAKIAADIEKKRNEQRGKMQYSPITGNIACIGMYNGEDQIILKGDEKKMISDFLEILGNDHYITYNGKGFDMDFIMKKALYYGLVGLREVKEHTDKYKAQRHTDIMELYCKYGEMVKLDLLCRVYLGEADNDHKLEWDHSTTGEAIKTEEGMNKLAEYCMQDVILTWRLAERFKLI